MDNFSEFLEQLTTAQLARLGVLVYLAIREETTVLYQFEEWGFEDVPQDIIVCCDFSTIPLEHIVTKVASNTQQDLVTIPKAKK